MADLFTTLATLAKTGVEIADATDQAKRNAQLIEFQKAVIGLQSDIAAVQAQNASLQSRNRDLENELSRLGDWEKQRQRYTLVNVWDGAVAYALKESHKDTDAPHWLCANCFETRKRSMLNQVEDKNRWTIVVCPSCRGQFQSPWRGQIPIKFAEEYVNKA